MTNIDQIKEIITEHQIEIINLRFTNIMGSWHHFSYNVHYALDLLEEGFAFDGSSIKGWCKISNSDMLMKPDLSTAFIDPFATYPTLVFICDIQIPGLNQNYSRDPRSIAKQTITMLAETKIADQAFFGPEPEFFIFDQAKFNVDQHNSYFNLSSQEFANTDNNLSNNYLICDPCDTQNNLRSEILHIINNIGIKGNLHHHEVAGSQGEIGFQYADLVSSCDNVQKFKYVARNVAASYGKSLTFMPKPIIGENGSGMHIHQSLWNKHNNLFAGKDYANLSKMALHYIGGIIKHGKSLNAFTNSTTNSYKRLVPGFEAPVNLSYSASNRSAAIRIPYAAHDKARRIEARFPDAVSNPYLSMTALLMAGIDGIINKIDPGVAIEQNLYELSNIELKTIPNLSVSLDNSLESLAQDHQFLLRNNVFTKDFIENYIKIKQHECDNLNKYPHPLEFKIYYNI